MSLCVVAARKLVLTKPAMRCFSLVVYLLCDKLALHDKSRLIEALSRTPYIDCAETVAPTVYVEETIGPHSGRQSLNVEVHSDPVHYPRC